jgi:hypothetical protein
LNGRCPDDSEGAFELGSRIHKINSSLFFVPFAPSC